MKSERREGKCHENFSRSRDWGTQNSISRRWRVWSSKSCETLGRKVRSGNRRSGLTDSPTQKQRTNELNSRQPEFLDTWNLKHQSLNEQFGAIEIIPVQPVPIPNSQPQRLRIVGQFFEPFQVRRILNGRHKNLDIRETVQLQTGRGNMSAEVGRGRRGQERTAETALSCLEERDEGQWGGAGQKVKRECKD